MTAVMAEAKAVVEVELENQAVELEVDVMLLK